jgi:hypothetical protein
MRMIDDVRGRRSVASATRIDPTSQITETASFLGESGATMFSVLHRPAGPAVAGVVVCPPLYADAVQNYRREVRLARELAMRGYAVQRFHYRCTGHSYGEGLDLTYDGLCDDANEALAHLIDSTGVDCVAFVGTRLGALVAARVAGPHAGAPLVVWEPTLEARQYFREAFRAIRITSIRGPGGGRTTSAPAEQRLLEDGWVDVVGHTVGRRLFETTRARTLDGELGEQPRPVLVVRLAFGETPQPLKDSIGQWTSRGFDVTVCHADSHEAWWFIDDDAAPTSSPVLPTVEWLEASLGAGSVS